MSPCLLGDFLVVDFGDSTLAAEDTFAVLSTAGDRDLDVYTVGWGNPVHAGGTISGFWRIGDIGTELGRVGETGDGAPRGGSAVVTLRAG